MKNLLQKKWMFSFVAFLCIFLSTTSAANYIVSGAGRTELNGTYVETGMFNEKPLYILDGEYAIGFYMGRWMIGRWRGDEIRDIYTSNSTNDTPPSTGWEGFETPIPTVERVGRSLSYSTSHFTEHTANDGSIANSIVITYNEYEGDTFTGDINDNFITDNKVLVSNIPAGLTATMIKTATNQLTFSLTGQANHHAKTDIIQNINVQFENTAFSEGNVANVSHYTKSDIGIQYILFSGGEGTELSPYLISNKMDLKNLMENVAINNLWDKYYKQTTNIAFEAADFESGGDFYNEGKGWSPIGTDIAPYFTGSYNGQNHTISGLYINSATEYYQGFFGSLGAGANIENLGVIDVNITGNYATGGLAGTNRSGTIRNCYTSGNVSGTSHRVGGLVGSNDGGTISNCHSSVNIIGNEIDNGGLIGFNTTSTIIACYSTGNVSGTTNTGGLIGQNTSFSTITNCYSTGNVTRLTGSDTNIGGFVGLNNNYNTITNSYSTGSVSYTGATNPTNKGFAGSTSGTILNCYWDTQTSGQSTSASTATGKTTAEMKTQATFISWDFATTPVWKIDGSNNNGYPYLAWQTFVPEIEIKQGNTVIVDNIGIYDFGSQTTSTNTDVIFTIDNTGLVTSTLGNFTITGTDADQFSLQGTNPTTLAAGGTATFKVRFTPTSAGSKTATITFENQDADENPYSFTITGTGAVPMQLVFTTTGATQTISLPLGGTVNCTLNWGDGSAPENVTTSGFASHTYAEAGTYAVTISGTLSSFGNGDDSWHGVEYLTEVKSFGDVGLTALGGAFAGAKNLSSVPALLPSTITSLNNCFSGIPQESITNLNLWDVSNVTNMQYMFFETTAFNQDISGWNVSHVTKMSMMFMLAAAFNKNISGWDVSLVTNMDMMFGGASSFNQAIGNWDVSQVESMSGMFYAATAFDQNISGWKIGKVTHMDGMFEDVCLSTANYDALLKGWAAQIVQNDVTFSGGTSKYSAGTAATARDVLTSVPNSWTITDGGINIPTDMETGQPTLWLQVTPNPVTDAFRLNNLVDEADITVMDMTGKIYQRAHVSSASVISMDQLPAGIYLLTVETAEKITPLKLVKK